MFKEALFNSDRYQYTMSKIHLKTGKDKSKAVFNFFFRKAPDGNNWAIVAGVNEFLNLIKTMNTDEYTQEEKIDIFKKILSGKNSDENEIDEICKKLATMKYTGNVYSMREGEIVFPNEPIITLEGPLVETQILETPLLSIMNHACLIATKASRIVRAAKGIPVSSFGSRRAHGPWSSILGDKAAYIGGCSSVSNIMTDYLYDIQCTGTMAHSFIESYAPPSKDNEYLAFKDFVQYNDEGNNILLIDTFDVLKSGLPNAIKVFKEFDLEKRYLETGDGYGIRLDSGDLAYLSKKCREELNKNGLEHARIIVTNGLDEYSIKELLDQGAEADGFGVGDAIATSKHNPCFGGVFKLAQIDNIPTIKLSEDTIKVINPGFQNVYRIYQNSEAKGDLITLRENDSDLNKLLNAEELTIRAEFDKRQQTTFAKDTYQYRELLLQVVKDGEILGKFDVEKARAYRQEVLDSFSESCTRLLNPHIYKVDISNDLYDLKMKTIYDIENSLK